LSISSGLEKEGILRAGRPLICSALKTAAIWRLTT